MAYDFNPTTVATKSKLLNRGFSDIPDDAAAEMAGIAWATVKSAGLPDEQLESGMKIYTAHLFWDYSYGGISSDASNTTKVKAGALEKQTGGAVSYDTSRDDPFLRQWNDLLKNFSNKYSVGLVVVP